VISFNPDEGLLRFDSADERIRRLQNFRVFEGGEYNVTRFSNNSRCFVNDYAGCKPHGEAFIISAASNVTR